MMRSNRVFLIVTVLILAIMPFVTYFVRGRFTPIPSRNDNYNDVDEFLTTHKNRTQRKIQKIQSEKVFERFSEFLYDPEEFSYPSYHSSVKGAGVDMGRILSSRRFLKILQHLQSLPPIRQKEFFAILKQISLTEFRTALDEKR